MGDYWENQSRENLINHLRAVWKEVGETQDILAEALGYQRDEPDGPEGGGYIIGEHWYLTLAMEAATRIKNLEEDNSNLGMEIVGLKDDLEDANIEIDYLVRMSW